MRHTQNLRGWLDHLMQLTPVTGLVEVGAGDGGSAVLFDNQRVPRYVMLEADKRLWQHLEILSKRRPHWSAHHALLAGSDGEQTFYEASNPDESGLVPADQLTTLWKNLSTVSTDLRVATTLERFLESVGTDSAAINWLILDCIPAVPLLMGAGDRLLQLEVVIARVVTQEGVVPVSGASKSELDAFLGEKGYRCIAIEEELHPALSIVIYARDWKSATAAHKTELFGRGEELRLTHHQLHDMGEKIAQLEARHEESLANLRASRASDRQEIVEQIAQQRHSHEQALRELQHRHQHELTELTNRYQAGQARLADREDQYSKLAQIALEIEGTLAQAHTESEAQRQLAADLARQLQELTTARANEHVQKETEWGNLRREIAALQEQAKDLARAKESDQSEAEKRQAQLDTALRDLAEQRILSAKQHAEIDQLIRSRDNQAQVALEAKREVERLKRVIADENGLTRDRLDQITALEAQRNQLSQTVLAANEELKRAANRESELSAGLSSTRIEVEQLTSLRHIVEELTVSRDEAVALATARASELAEVSNERSDLIQRVASLQEQSGTLKNECEISQHQAATRQAELDVALRALEENRISAAKQLDRLGQLNLMTEEQARVALEAKRQAESLTHDLEEARQVARDRSQSARMVQEDLQRTAARECTLNSDISSARAELAHLTNSQKELTEHLEQARLKIAGLESSSAGLQSALTEARQTVALSVKLQTLREADLQDLQHRYQASVESRQKQHRLLTTLSERLSVASSYFNQLNLPQPAVAPFDARATTVPNKRRAAVATPSAPRRTRKNAK
jgi:chromosome segregation ATPase